MADIYLEHTPSRHFCRSIHADRAEKTCCLFLAPITEVNMRDHRNGEVRARRHFRGQNFGFLKLKTALNSLRSTESIKESDFLIKNS